MIYHGWWRNPESNWGHKDFQSSALPTELFRRTHGKTKGKFKTKVCLLVNRERIPLKVLLFDILFFEVIL